MKAEQWAAWVSAAAACVQAIGAIAAIFYAVRLAHAADARAIASERASLAREEAARKESAEREDAANRAAETRYSNAQTLKNMAAIIPCEERLGKAIKMCKEQIAHYSNMKPGELGYNSTHQGDFGSQDLIYLKKDADSLRTLAASPDLIAWFTKLPGEIDSITNALTWNETREGVVVKLQNTLPRLEALLSQVSAFRLE